MYKISFSALLLLAKADSYGYDASQSTWYSPSLSSDGYGSTSYDYTYTNSYSYDSSVGDVHRWDYGTWDWNTTDSHTADYESTWYSSSLQSDGNGATSYDYTYGNSYSYDSSAGDVHKFDYSTWDWNTTDSHSAYSYESTWYSSSL